MKTHESDRLAAWQLDFLRREGLQPHHVLLEVGGRCVDVSQYLEPKRYYAIDFNGAPASLDLEQLPTGIDFAIFPSLLTRLSLNAAAYCLASVLRRLTPGGRLYATWFENPDALSFDPIVHDNGVTTYPDAEPYHYPFVVIAAVCAALGADATGTGNRSHPGGESVLAITRR